MTDANTKSRSQTEREADIAELREEIGKLRRSEALKRDTADTYAAEVKGQGLNPITGTSSEDKEAFRRIDAAYKEADTFAEQALDLEHRLETLVVTTGHEADKRAGGDPGHPDMRASFTLGERFLASEAYRSLKRSASFDMANAPMRTNPVVVATRDQIMAVMFPTASLAAGLSVDSTFVPEDQQLFPPVRIPQRLLKIRDLVNVQQTDSDKVEWVEETVRTDNAAETPYGTNAPLSDYEYDRRSTDVKRIPHYIKATKGNLADAGQLRGLLDNNLVYGVGKRIDGQMINGNGVGDNLTGLLSTAGLDETDATGIKVTDAYHMGITAVRLLLEDEPDAFLLHPLSYEQFVLSKDSDGRYMNGQGPQFATPPNVWGKRAVVSTVIAQTSALVGNWKMGATLWVRSGVSVAVTDSDGDDFRKGIVTILAEMRAAFAVPQVRAFSEITNLGSAS